MEINLDDNILQFSMKECKKYYDKLIDKIDKLNPQEQIKFLDLVREQSIREEMEKINNITEIPPMEYVYYLEMFENFIKKVQRIIRFID